MKWTLVGSEHLVCMHTLYTRVYQQATWRPGRPSLSVMRTMPVQMTVFPFYIPTIPPYNYYWTSPYVKLTKKDTPPVWVCTYLCTYSVMYVRSYTLTVPELCICSIKQLLLQSGPPLGLSFAYGGSFTLTWRSFTLAWGPYALTAGQLAVTQGLHMEVVLTLWNWL